MREDDAENSNPTACESVTEGQSRKPPVLYIDRRYDSLREDSFAVIIAASLRGQYDVETGFNLGPWAVSLVQARLAANPFAAIVTHVPFDPGTPSYGQSLDVLHKLKLAADIPIIAYTGAKGPILSSTWEYVDHIVEKSHSIGKDAEEIGEQLKRLLHQYKTRPEPQPPDIVRAEGKTTIRVRVHLNVGLAWLAGHHLAKQCESYPGEVTLASLAPDGDPTPHNCKDAFKLLDLVATEGTEVLLSVEGIDPAAEQLARRLYSGITSRYAFDMKWDRFEPSPADRSGRGGGPP